MLLAEVGAVAEVAEAHAAMSADGAPLYHGGGGAGPGGIAGGQRGVDWEVEVHDIAIERPRSPDPRLRAHVARAVLLLLVAAAAYLLAACGPPPQALSVNTTIDAVDAVPGDGVCQTSTPGECTVRAAVQEANATAGQAQIDLAPGAAYVLSLAGTGEDAAATGDLDLTDDLVLRGHDATIDAAGIDRVVQVHTGTTVIGDVVVTGGATTSTGGGVRTEASTNVGLSNVTLRQNTAASGGAVASAGTLTITVSELTANTANGAGTASAFGGAVHHVGAALTIDRSTLSANVATSSAGSPEGGAIRVDSGTLDVANSTFSANRATGTVFSSGGGISSAATTMITASTFSDNRGAMGRSVAQVAGTVTVHGSILDAFQNTGSCNGTITSTGYNLVSDTSCGFAGPGDAMGIDPLLNSLADNGGLTPTHLPSLGSPAVDAIANGTAGLCDGTLPTDQRQISRPENGACDIGAVEGDSGAAFPTLSLTVDDTGDTADAAPGDGVCATATSTCTLRAAVDETNAWLTADTITVQAGLGTIAVGQPIVISGSVVVVGNGATIDGPDTGARVLQVTAGFVSLRHLTITQSAVQILEVTGGTVEVVDTVIADNTTLGFPFVRVAGGSLTLRRSELRANLNGGGVATIDQVAGQLRLENVTMHVLAWSGQVYYCHIYGCTWIPYSYTQDAIHIAAGTLDVRSTTIHDAKQAIDHFQGTGTVTVAASIINGACRGIISSGGYNIVHDDAYSSCTQLADPTDLVSSSPGLDETTTANGGPTGTFLLASNSPALDAVPPGTPSLCDGTIPTDQRGVARPAGGACDIGAAEGSTGATASFTFTVDDAGDTSDAQPGNGRCDDAAGRCTLRSALDEANAFPTDDAIEVTDGLPTITLAKPGSTDNANASGDLDVLAPVTVHGGGATLDAAGLDRAIELHEVTATIEGFTITGGQLTGTSARGAGVRVRGGNVTLDTVHITGNQIAGTGGMGGGVYLGYGSLVIDKSTISANSVASNTAGGGGLYVNTGVAKLYTSTISGNTAWRGAGIYRYGGKVEATFTTLTANSGWETLIAIAEVTVTASIVDATTFGTACTGIVASGGWNVAADTSCNLTGTGDQQGVAPDLAVLADNGGPTPTHVPHLGSPALDVIPAGTAVVCTHSYSSPYRYDQRGTERTDAACDAGAVEGFSIENVPSLGLVVDDPGDTIDVAPGDGLCVDAGGACTLRAAVMETNSWLQEDSITIAPGIDPVLSLAGPGNEADAATGDLDITGDLTITGGGATVDAAGIGRVFHIVDPQPSQPGAPDVTIEALTITGGQVSGSASDSGGGILHNAGWLHLTDITLTGNSAAASGGGAAFLHGTGTVTLTRVNVIGNTAANGGGIATTTATGVTNVIDSTFEANSATAISGSPPTQSGTGGGLLLNGVTTVRSSRIAGNDAGYGGGIATNGTTGTSGTITDSVIEGNTANIYGGGIIASSGTTTIEGSLLRDNTAGWIGGGGGGGIRAVGATVVRNSTLHHNVANITGTGGAIAWAGTAPLAVEFATISDNGALLATGSSPSASVATTTASPYATFTLTASLLDNAGTLAGTPACQAGMAGLVSGGYNVVGDNTCPLNAPSDTVGTPLMLEQLADNGGPTPTRLPYAGTPAVDRVPVGTPGLCDGTMATDQRGSARPVGPGCDAGSVEGDNGIPGQTLSLLVTTAADGVDASPGDGLCATAGGQCSMRAAVTEANIMPSADTITLTPGIDPVLSLAGPGDDTNATGDLDITDPLTIDGQGATISGGAIDRVLDGHADLTIDRTTVSGGVAEQGAGIRQIVGTLAITRSTVRANTATSATGSARGGGVAVTGFYSSATIDASTIEANVATSTASPPMGGGVYADMTIVTITASTISGNQATGTLFSSGGGVAAVASWAGIQPEVSLRRTTIAGNRAAQGRGVYSDEWTSYIRLTATVLDNNLGLAGERNCFSPTNPPVLSYGWNLSTDTTCGLAATGDQQGIPALLGLLASNGGATMTALPQAASPVVDAIPAGTAGVCDAAVSIDQRGLARPFGTGCDIGAVERQPADP